MACRCNKRCVESGMGIVDVSHGTSKRQSIGNYRYDLGATGDFPVVPYVIGGLILLYLTKKFVQA